MRLTAGFLFIMCILVGACDSDEICQKRQGLHEWNAYRWDPSNMNLGIKNDTGNKEWGERLDLVVDGWNSLDTMLWLDKSSDSRTDISVVLVEDEEWLGLAEVWLSARTGNVSRVRVSLNKTRLEGYTDAGKQHVLCQEVGHALGLFHIAGNTCMDDCSSFAANSPEKTACVNDETKSGPNEHDKEQLILMYGDYTETCIDPAETVVQ